MTVCENRNFLRVAEYKHNVSLQQVLSSIPTSHSQERTERIRTAIKVNSGAEIDRCFLVDKGHVNGPEIHYVTRNGCIFICNSRTKKFITVLIARPNQVIRLYKACGLFAPSEIVYNCKLNVEKNLNKI